jgi:hypothetical protein
MEINILMSTISNRNNMIDVERDALIGLDVRMR